MAYKQPKHSALSKLLNADKRLAKNTVLNQLIMKASTLESTNDAINSCLPKALQNQFQLNSTSHQCLTLTCHSASIATRFRMHQQAILEKLNRELPDSRSIKRIQIKIRPAISSRITQTSQRHLSKENAQLLEQEAGLTADLKLKEALLRLSRRSST